MRKMHMGKTHQHKPKKHPKVFWQIDKIDKAEVGDTIEWSTPGGADDTDMTIWFPRDPNWDPLGIGETKIPAGGKLTKTVPPGVRKDTYRYSIFCHKDGKMVEGPNSPPEMEVV
jgi:hypothetical protein